MDWRSFIQEAMAWSTWAVQWASDTAHRNLLESIAALVAIIGAPLGCYRTIRWLRGKGLDKTVDQIDSSTKSTHSIVERLEKNKQIPESDQASITHKIKHRHEHIFGDHYLKRPDGSIIEFEPTPQLLDLEERLIGVKKKK